MHYFKKQVFLLNIFVWSSFFPSMKVLYVEFVPIPIILDIS